MSKISKQYYNKRGFTDVQPIQVNNRQPNSEVKEAMQNGRDLCDVEIDIAQCRQFGLTLLQKQNSDRNCAESMSSKRTVTLHDTTNKMFKFRKKKLDSFDQCFQDINEIHVQETANSNGTIGLQKEFPKANHANTIKKEWLDLDLL